MNDETKAPFVKQLRADYEKARAQHAGQQVKLLSLADARANAPKLSYANLPKPAQIGVRVLSSELGQRGATTSVQVSDLIPFIDWTPFFHAWELRGVYPAILEHPKYGEQAKKLFPSRDFH